MEGRTWRTEPEKQFLKEQQRQEISVDTWRKPGVIPLMKEDPSHYDPHHLAVRIHPTKVTTLLYEEFRIIPDRYKPRDWLEVMPDPSDHEINARALKHHLVNHVLKNAYHKEFTLSDETVRHLDSFL